MYQLDWVLPSKLKQIWGLWLAGGSWYPPTTPGPPLLWQWLLLPRRMPAHPRYQPHSRKWFSPSGFYSSPGEPRQNWEVHLLLCWKKDFRFHVRHTHWGDFPWQRDRCVHCDGWRKLMVFSSWWWTELPLIDWLAFSCGCPWSLCPWSCSGVARLIAGCYFGWKVFEERLWGQLGWVRLLSQLDSLEGFNGTLGRFGGGINERRGLLVGKGRGGFVGGISVYGGQGGAFNLPQSHWDKRQKRSGRGQIPGDITALGFNPAHLWKVKFTFLREAGQNPRS